VQSHTDYFAVVGLFLNGALLSNSTLVLLGEIGDGIGALYCLTNRGMCCGTATGSDHGVWKFPNGTNVGEDTTANIYMSRGFSSLLLKRRSSTMGPTGVYICEIPDAGGVLRTLTISIINCEFHVVKSST
jgi:hypothetical protein